MTREEIYNEILVGFREKLKQITDPVALKPHNRSYDALCDVISNVILLEINLGRKPFEEITFKEVRLPTSEKVALEAISLASRKQLAQELLRRIDSDISYTDMAASSLHKSTVASMGLYSALVTFIENEHTS